MKAIVVALFTGLVGCAFVQRLSAEESAKYSETVLHSFGNGEDGQQPYAGVIDVKGVLYGTTYSGGGVDGGVVFAVDPKTGAEKVVHSFDGNPDAYPEDSLIDVKGTLYGTTSGNGDSAGSVFALDPNTDAEKTLYTFCSKPNCTDGFNPLASLVDVKGTLYGTALLGGAGAKDCDGLGCGTVFSLDRSTGAEKVLYSFCSQPNCADGSYPVAALIDVDGILYGTTELGGVGDCNGSGTGCGTVFSLDPKTGAEKVLYAFCSQPGCADGAEPGGVININGKLYGSTFIGGKGTGCKGGCGTVFSINPKSPGENVLYSFCSQPNCADGANAGSSLMNLKGAFYGTTSSGGAYNQGTVFMLMKKS